MLQCNANILRIYRQSLVRCLKSKECQTFSHLIPYCILCFGMMHIHHSHRSRECWIRSNFNQSEGVCVAAQSGLGLCSVHMSSTQTVETCMNFSVLKRWHKLNHTELNYNIFGHERVVEIYDHHHHIARYRLSLTNSILILFIFMIRHMQCIWNCADVAAHNQILFA